MAPIKRSHKTLTLAEKSKILDGLDVGKSTRQIAENFAIPKSTVFDIKKNKDKIRSFISKSFQGTGNILLFSEGVTIGWSATVVPILNSNDTSVNPLPEPPTTLESSWIVSSMFLGTIVAPFLGGIIVKNFGKKKAILILGVPVFLGNLIIAFATQVWIFILARFMWGLSLGCTLGIIASYAGAVAEDKNRGLLGSLIGVFLGVGALFTYTVAPFISIKLFSLINLIPLSIFFTIFGLFVPDTPYDLLQKNSIEKAKESLAFYRGKTLTEVESEFKKLLDNQGKNKGDDQNKVSTKEIFKTIFKTKSLRKGLSIALSILTFQGFSGMPAVNSYTQTIFDESGGSLESVYSVMVIGVTALLSSIVLSQLVERLGRRMLIIVSYVFLALPSFSLGTYFLLKSKGYNMEPISWLPMASLIIFTIAYNVEAGIPLVLLTDMLPSNFLDISSHLASFTLFFLGFLITLVYPFVTEAVGNYVSFYIFGICDVCAVIFCYVTVPETKGKSVEEVQKILNKR